MINSQPILLLGPTGSGKTPLGDLCEQKGLWGKRCAHFDFGEQLRRIARGECPGGIEESDIRIVLDSLRTGALLENEDFRIARNLLLSFVEEKQLHDGNLLLLNGLPRHIGQAIDIDELFDVTMVVNLECTPQTVHERIRLNAGGDRLERKDDSLPEIENKMKLFADRTLPLLNHYRGRGVRVIKTEVELHSSAEVLYQWLDDIDSDGLQV